MDKNTSELLHTLYQVSFWRWIGAIVLYSLALLLALIGLGLLVKKHVIAPKDYKLPGRRASF
jgi:hypothetical protein